ncbi:MAG: hypothetical protein AAGD34_11605, partial [Pseudomonadota bacterium]
RLLTFPCVCLALTALFALAPLAPANAQSSAEDINAAVAAGDKRYALLVGVADYDQTVDVRFVKDNLDAVEAVLRETLLVPKANIRRIEDPTTIGLMSIFGYKPGEPGSFGGLDVTEPDAELYVYFVGHGSRDLRAAGTSNAAESEGFLLATDSNPAELSRTAYSYDTMVANLDTFQKARFPDGRVILFMESCFSGESNDGPLNPTMGPMIDVVEGLDNALEGHDVVAIAAAGADTPAYWDDERRKGIFTHALTEGLRGRADLMSEAPDGTVTLDELDAWLKQAVPARARTLGKSAQTPQVKASGQTAVFSLPGDAMTAAADTSDVEVDFEVEYYEQTFEDTVRQDRAGMAALLGELEGFMDQCGDRCRRHLPKLIPLRNELRMAVRRCDAAAAMASRHLGRGAFDRVARFSAICAPKEVVAACVGSGDANSAPCRCLVDASAQDCEAAPVAECGDLLAEAKANALTTRSLAPLTAFTRDNPSCAEDTAAVADAQAAVCSASGGSADNGAVPPGLQDCPWAKRREAMNAEVAACKDAFDAVLAAAADNLRLAQFLRQHEDCPQIDAAHRLRSDRIDEALSRAREARSDAERRASVAELQAMQSALTQFIDAATLREMAEARRTLQLPACDVAFQQARSGGTAAMLSFASARPECPEAAVARRTAMAGQCRDAFDRVRTDDARDLFAFMEKHGDCKSEVASAQKQLEVLATQCIHAAGGLEMSDPGKAIRSYRQCNATFGFELKWVGEEASASVARLQRTAFCAQSYGAIGEGDQQGLERFIARSSADCPQQALEARRRLQAQRTAFCANTFDAIGYDDRYGLQRFISQSGAACPDQANQARVRLDQIAAAEASPDGYYVGVRGYTDRRRRSPRKSCLGRYEFTANVSNGEITFYSDNRSWRGTVSRDGSVNIDLGGISPPPKHDTYVYAKIDNGRANGTLYNGYCGNGFFQITRQ